MGSYSQCLLCYAVCYNITGDYFSLFRAYAGNGVIIRECTRNREKTLLLALHAGPFTRVGGVSCNGVAFVYTTTLFNQECLLIGAYALKM